MSDESIFAAALGKAPGVERRAFLDGACGGDEALRRRIERLLEADDRTAGILERGPDAGPTDAPGEDGPPLLPERVFAGRFKLRQKLGEGGMGEVWVADQAAPVQRRVAIKVVRPGLDSERMLARFDQERQALALMDHPNIAKVLDAGEADGRPYFVMELIKGVPITDYCDRARLSPRERLALFVPVCEAVQHAHQKGVVHRDLKPSNILVALYDGRPVPKVIDFGIAKATGPRLTDRSIYTEVGALIGTLEYMAPEQAELNNLDIDTRADVYALGAILYELLTGSVPFSRQELQAAGFLEMLRVIREVEPPRPSTKLSKSGTLPSVADVRRTDPQKLVSLMRGELDWIILKCLEKDRGRRYQAASGLARDLEHYLADEPVEACPPTAGYRLRKFARKYRTPMLVAGSFVLLLALGAIVAAWQAVRATSAERVARRAEFEAKEERLAALAAKQQALEAKAETEAQRDEARLAAYASGIGLAQRAWEENNVVRARELLEAVPTEAAGRNLRGFEWFYLSRLCRAEERNLVGDPGRVDSLAFSPDGQRLASGSRDQTLKIWDTTTAKALLTFKGHAGWVNSVAFSPDGQRLASGSDDRTVKIWDCATGKELFALKGHASQVGGLAFSPDGQRLASGGYDKTVKIWDSATGRELLSLKGHAGFVTSVAFSPDGQRLASGNEDGSIHFWETMSVSREIQRRREVSQMVAELFGQMPLRADVLERLPTLSGMTASRRQEAITVAETYPEDTSALNDLARELVKLPGGETSGVRKALRYSEEACQLEPENGDFLNTLGVAYYRVGNYEKALDVLSRSDKINTRDDKGSNPTNLAFLAMTHQQLGHAREAEAKFQLLRERMKDPRFATDAKAWVFAREAEELLAKPKAPGSR